MSTIGKSDNGTSQDQGRNEINSPVNFQYKRCANKTNTAIINVLNGYQLN